MPATTLQKHIQISQIITIFAKYLQIILMIISGRLKIIHDVWEPIWNTGSTDHLLPHYDKHLLYSRRMQGLGLGRIQELAPQLCPHSRLKEMRQLPPLQTPSSLNYEQPSLISTWTPQASAKYFTQRSLQISHHILNSTTATPPRHA